MKVISTKSTAMASSDYFRAVREIGKKTNEFDGKRELAEEVDWEKTL